jgi:hypothetical protein
MLDAKSTEKAFTAEGAKNAERNWVVSNFWAIRGFKILPRFFSAFSAHCGETRFMAG